MRMRIWGMRTGISLTVLPIDRQRLTTLVRDRNNLQKHVCRAEIVLLSADGVGTVEIMRRTGKSKTGARRELAPRCGGRRGRRFLFSNSGRSGASVGAMVAELWGRRLRHPRANERTEKGSAYRLKHLMNELLAKIIDAHGGKIFCRPVALMEQMSHVAPLLLSRLDVPSWGCSPRPH
jgi:hypothetical protein